MYGLDQDEVVLKTKSNLGAVFYNVQSFKAKCGLACPRLSGTEGGIFSFKQEAAMSRQQAELNIH